jgi:hypothetical protein
VTTFWTNKNTQNVDNRMQIKNGKKDLEAQLINYSNVTEHQSFPSHKGTTFMGHLKRNAGYVGL